MNTQNFITEAKRYFEPKHNWSKEEVNALFEKNFYDLLLLAQLVHRNHFTEGEIQTSSLLSIKTGSCPEDCKYCPQSAHYKTEVEKASLMKLDEIVSAATKAKEAGASRFCMGAAWKKLHDRDIDTVCNIVSEVKNLGMETCMTLGMLTKPQAEKLQEAGLDYYNHNIDTSPEFYDKIITTRSFADRIDTINNVRASGIKVCCGGIIGLGETLEDRASMLLTLANMEEHPDSVPINKLVQVPGTPLYNKVEKVTEFDFIRVIAVARILMPKSVVRLSAGREEMSKEMQALCFMAGANSIFYGEKLLTTANPEMEKDLNLLSDLGLKIKPLEEREECCSH